MLPCSRLGPRPVVLWEVVEPLWWVGIRGEKLLLVALLLEPGHHEVRKLPHHLLLTSL